MKRGNYKCLFLTEESRYACSDSLENDNNSLRGLGNNWNTNSPLFKSAVSRLYEQLSLAVWWLMRGLFYSRDNTPRMSVAMIQNFLRE
jgi:hypothetical protein